MCELLISIASQFEAEIVNAFGLGIVDLKDPSQGALGAVAAQNLAPIVSKLPDDQVVSLAMGELIDYVEEESNPKLTTVVFEMRERLERFAFAKIGLSRLSLIPDWQSAWMSFMSGLPDSTAPVGVFYADHFDALSPDADAILKLLEGLPKAGLLIDTHNKAAGDSISIIGKHKICQIIERASRSNIATVLAGSLGLESLQDAIECRPNFIGFRGAVCESGRHKLSKQKLADLVETFEKLAKANP